jgi:hypothetical protein
LAANEIIACPPLKECTDSIWDDCGEVAKRGRVIISVVPALAGTHIVRFIDGAGRRTSSAVSQACG